MNARAVFGRQTTIVCLLIAVGLAVVLLAIKHRVQSLEGELAALRRQTVAEQEMIRVLEAEFAYLTQPDRLRRLARDHLGLVPVDPGQLATFATLDEALARTPPAAKPGHGREKGDARVQVRVAARGGAQR
jgi:cell division protein FtsL